MWSIFAPDILCCFGECYGLIFFRWVFYGLFWRQGRKFPAATDAFFLSSPIGISLVLPPPKRFALTQGRHVILCFPHCGTAGLNLITDWNRRVNPNEALDQHEKERHLVAHVFACWTIASAQHFFENKTLMASRRADNGLETNRTKFRLPRRNGQVVGVGQGVGVASCPHRWGLTVFISLNLTDWFPRHPPPPRGRGGRRCTKTLEKWIVPKSQFPLFWFCKGNKGKQKDPSPPGAGMARWSKCSSGLKIACPHFSRPTVASKIKLTDLSRTCQAGY